MNRENSSRRLQIPAKRYRIGELVRYSPFSRQTIHNYTIMGLIREAEWTEGGHRLYDESVFDRLSRIMELKQSMSLTEIRRVLSEEEKNIEAGAHGRPCLRNSDGSPATSGRANRRVTGGGFVSPNST
jgi:DNA-binding transcriptional MerR regulator